MIHKTEMVKLFRKVQKCDCYEFQLGELKTIITIKIFKTKNGYRGEKSHYIKTPLKSYPASEFIVPLHHSTKDRDNERLMKLTMKEVLIELYEKYFKVYYLEAIDKGYKPSETWLVRLEE